MLRWLTSFVLLALPLASAYQLAAGRAGRGPSFARVASQMQMAPGGPQQMQKIDSKDTYNVMMRVLLETNASVADQISASYHMVDYAFLQKLDQRAESEKDEEVAARTSMVEKTPWFAAAHTATDRSRSPPACGRQPCGAWRPPVPLEHTAIRLVSLWLPLATQARIAEIKEAVNIEMKTRIEAATVTFKDIVGSPSAIIMEGKIAGLSRQGKVKPDDETSTQSPGPHPGPHPHPHPTPDQDPGPDQPTPQARPSARSTTLS